MSGSDPGPGMTTGFGDSGTAVPAKIRPSMSAYRKTEGPSRRDPNADRSMSGLPPVPGSPIASEDAPLHSEKPPSTCGALGRPPTYPRSRTDGVKRRETIPSVTTTQGPTIRSPYVSPAPPRKSPTTVHWVDVPGATLLEGKVRSASRPTGVTWAMTLPPASRSRSEVTAVGVAVPKRWTWTESTATGSRAAPRVSPRIGTSVPKRTSETRGRWSTRRVPTRGLIGKSARSESRSHEEA